MRFQLRDYQQRGVDDLRAAFRSGYRAPLLSSPTGSGKTVCFAHIAEQADQRGNAVMVLVHRRELLAQTSKALNEIGVRHQLIAPHQTVHDVRADQLRSLGASTIDQTSRLQVASVQTLVRRLDRTPAPDLIVIDEAHHAVAGSWHRVIEAFTRARLLGVTATPHRLDGKGLGVQSGGPFDTLVEGPTVRELIDAGYLCQPVVYAPPLQASLEGVHVRGGDYAAGELAERLDKPRITGDAIDHYRRLCDGAPAIAFCANVQHAQHVAEQFRQAGYRWQCVDGTMRSSARDRAIRGLGDGSLHGISSCEIVNEGTDVPIVAAGIMLRATQSLSLWLQQCLDDETEVLTRRGWMRRTQVRQEDLVAAMDMATGAMEWSPALRIVDRPLGDESMYAISSPHLDIRVTAGHDMVVRGVSRTCINWQKQTAEHISRRRAMFRVPVSATPEDESRALLTDNEIRFIGWFLADGTKDRTTNAVSISQSAGKKSHCNEIRRVLRGCGLKFGECHVPRSGEDAKYDDLVFFSVSYGEPRGRDTHLRGWAHLEAWIDKSIGEAFDSLSSRQFGILLEAMNLGDGANMHKPAGWTRRTMCITTGNDRSMADRLQALCVTRGYRCNVGFYEANGRGPWFYLYIKKKAAATIAGTGNADGEISGKSYRRSRFQRVQSQADERVWCVENALGTLFIRRNGKVAIVGNCGRILRPYEGKSRAFILDHVGNSLNPYLGLPDWDREWSLEGEEKRKGGKKAPPAPPVWQCPQCYAAHEPADRCPMCGHVYAQQHALPQEEEGELTEVTPEQAEAMRRARKREVAKATTYEDLKRIEAARGYKPGWADHVFAAKKRKRQAA